jgi:hypothetical protein
MHHVVGDGRERGKFNKLKKFRALNSTEVCATQHVVPWIVPLLCHKNARKGRRERRKSFRVE